MAPFTITFDGPTASRRFSRDRRIARVHFAEENSGFTSPVDRGARAAFTDGARKDSGLLDDVTVGANVASLGSIRDRAPFPPGKKIDPP